MTNNIEKIQEHIFHTLRHHIMDNNVIDLYDIKREDYDLLVDELTDGSIENILSNIGHNLTPSLICFVRMLDKIYDANGGVGDCYLWANLCGNGLEEDGYKALYKRVIKEYASLYIGEIGYEQFIIIMKRINVEILEIINSGNEIV